MAFNNNNKQFQKREKKKYIFCTKRERDYKIVAAFSKSSNVSPRKKKKKKWDQVFLHKEKNGKLTQNILFGEK